MSLLKLAESSDQGGAACPQDALGALGTASLRRLRNPPEMTGVFSPVSNRGLGRFSAISCIAASSCPDVSHFTSLWRATVLLEGGALSPTVAGFLAGTAPGSPPLFAAGAASCAILARWPGVPTHACPPCRALHKPFRRSASRRQSFAGAWLRPKALPVESSGRPDCHRGRESRPRRKCSVRRVFTPLPDGRPAGAGYSCRRSFRRRLSGGGSR